MRLRGICIGLLCWPLTARAQPLCASSAMGSLEPLNSFQTSPQTPRAGTLFHVRIAKVYVASPIDMPVTRVAGELLHFHDDGDSLVAIAPVPIDSVEGVSLEVRCEAQAPFRVRIGSYANEAEATKDQARAKKKGLKGARVVKVEAP